MKKTQVDVYINKISRMLICSKKVKEKVMHGFKLEISEYLDDLETVTYDDLVNTFGTPKDVCIRMQEDIPKEEVKREKRRKKIIGIVLIIALLLALACSITIVVLQAQQKELKVTETIRIDP